jgi:hypothetical protein
MHDAHWPWMQAARCGLFEGPSSIGTVFMVSVSNSRYSHSRELLSAAIEIQIAYD